MASLVCFGFGYCAEHFVAEYGGKFDPVVVTVRSPERVAILNAYAPAKLRAVLFDGVHASLELNDALAQAKYVLSSIPPGETGDPVLATFTATAARNLRSVVY